MAKRRRKAIAPDPNPFVRLYEQRLVEEMFKRENLPMIDPDLYRVSSSKPSPASTPSAGRVESMEVRARQRKTQEFIAKKHLQRALRKEHDE